MVQINHSEISEEKLNIVDLFEKLILKTFFKSIQNLDMGEKNCKLINSNHFFK